MILGIPVGLLSGYFGGWLDTLFMRACDIIVAFPSLLLAFVFVASFGRGLGNAVLALGIIYVPMLSKLTRSLVLVEKEKVYVEACHSIGYGSMRIMFGHILPNCVSTIAVQVTLDVGYAILDLASMSFLGLGIQPPMSDWGAMLEDGRIFLNSNTFLALAPGIAIVVTVVAINVFSDGVQAYLDPSQRKLPSIKKFQRHLLDKSEVVKRAAQ
jgi:peptide/nickel transport system permease protein